MYYAQTLTLRFVYLFRALKLWIVDYKLMYETLKKESDKKDAIIKKLESRNKMLHSNLERIKEMIAAALKE